MHRSSTVGVCSVEIMVKAALMLASGVKDKPIPVSGLICLDCSKRRSGRAGRRLFQAMTLTELENIQGLADQVAGEYCWFRPSNKIGFGWRSRTNARLLSIPVPAVTEELLLGYLLQINLPHRQGSRYAGVFRNLGVQWQEGRLPGIVYGHKNEDRVKELQDAFAVLKRS